MPPPLLVPADRIVSVGTPVTVIATVSSPSLGVMAIGSAIVAPSFTVIDVAVPARLGASATGFTVRAMVCDTESPVVVLVAVTVSIAEDSPACSVRPASCTGVNVMLPLVTVSGPELSLSDASEGSPEIVTDRLPPLPPEPLTKTKSFATRLESATPLSVMVSAGSDVMTVSCPTCFASAIRVAKFANCAVVNSR